MIQHLPRVQTAVLFGSGVLPFPLLGAGAIINNVVYRAPMPWAVTLRNLVMYSGQVGRTGDVTQTLQKDGVNTALTGTLPAAATTQLLIDGIDVSFAQGEDCRWEFTGTGVGGGGYTFGWDVSLDSPGNIYGVSADQFGSAAAGNGGIGGALGNGFWQVYDHATWPAGNTCTSVSICATPGDATTLAIRTYATVPPVGAGWIAFIRLNKIIQDGSGGTVDTRCEIVGDGVTDFAISTFVLPLVVGDKVEIIYYRTGTALGFTFGNHIGASVGFIPTTADAFMLTGGANTALSLPNFVWTLSGPNQTDELLAQAPIGPGGFRVTGAYIEGPSPGVDPADQVTRYLRNTSVDTSIVIPLTQFQTSGLITGQVVDFVEGNFMSWRQADTGGSSPDGSTLYWGLEVIPRPLAGTIIVEKDAGGDVTQLFDFLAGGGLSPTGFQLVGGGVQTFLDVPAGSGYSIAELAVPPGWTLVSATTSNGDPIDNLTIIDGLTITVTFVNAMCPGERGDPRTDGLPYSPVPQAGA